MSNFAFELIRDITIHLVVCLTTGPKRLPKRALHLVRSRASSFKWGYSHLTEETLDRTMWRARFGRGFGPAVRQTTKW